MNMNVLITGGNGDLAKFLGQKLKAKGYEVIRPSKTDLNVADNNSVKDYLEDKYVDILINAAGTLHSGRFLETEPSLWENDIKVNLIGTYNSCWYVLRKNPKAKIINISSTAGFNAYKDWSSYCCSKAAVITLSKSLFNDGYDVYCVCPGAIDTKFRKNINIVNNNVMQLKEASKYIEDIVDNKYKSGDILFFRKETLILNPSQEIS